MSTGLVVSVVLVVVMLGLALGRHRIARRFTRRTGTWVGTSTP